MKIIDALLGEIKDSNVDVKNAWVGLHWTAIGSKYIGMSHTYKTASKKQIENANS